MKISKQRISLLIKVLLLGVLTITALATSAVVSATGPSDPPAPKISDIPPGSVIHAPMSAATMLKRVEMPGGSQIKQPKLGLTHNLGGYPGEMVSFVGIVGTS